MRKFFRNFLILLAVLSTAVSAKAVGWPANYQGVMLQGFYWDSYSETSWSKLTSQADELSKYFSLIWVPNSAQSMGNPAMGYAPIYYFTHHSSSFGSEAELRQMISTFKAKGTGIIEDVVINHRVGVRDWADFPSETWRNVTYSMDATSVCSTDEWGQGKGAKDTGEDFNGARDLDHTNTNVQNVLKNYCKFLIDDLGYVGFRLDMTKGYSGYYTKIYNQYSQPKFSVGEFWSGSYDEVSGWIEATGRESAAFDFPFKYAVNEAFHSNDMTKLVWKATGTTDQPAGLIHYGYPQFAVTFIDNHDTARDSNKFNGNVVAANAFMLCSPGTPCVFWPHYTTYKAEIQKLIAIRNEVGIHNLSPVNVLQVSRDCYMAEVTGANGKLVVKIGSAMVSPKGYTDSQIKASGTDYCVWTTTEGGVTPTPDPIPGSEMTIYFDNTNTKWAQPYVHYWGASQSDWPGVTMTTYKANIWKYTLPAGTTGLLFNAGDGDPTKTADFVAVDNHVYTTLGDQGDISNYKPVTNPDTEFKVYFDNSTSKWSTPYIHYWGKTQSDWPGVAMSPHKDNVWVYTVPAGTTGLLFNAGDGDPTKTSDFTAVANHIYSTTGDQGEYEDSEDPIPGNYPATLYLIGNINDKNWDTTSPIPSTGVNGHYTWSAVKFTNSGDGFSYFSFITVPGDSWDEVNSGDRYGSDAYYQDEENSTLNIGEYAEIVHNPANVSAMGARSWKIPSGTYNVDADLENMKVRVFSGQNGVVDFEFDIDATQEVEFYNMQGVRVLKLNPGIYICRQGNVTSKVIIR